MVLNKMHNRTECDKYQFGGQEGDGIGVKVVWDRLVEVELVVQPNEPMKRKILRGNCQMGRVDERPGPGSLRYGVSLVRSLTQRQLTGSAYYALTDDQMHSFLSLLRSILSDICHIASLPASCWV